jgi:hypothetical protein
MAEVGKKAQRETGDHEGAEGPYVYAAIHWSPIYSWGVPHPAHDDEAPRPRRRLYLAVMLVCIVAVAAGVGLGAVLSSSSHSTTAPSSTSTTAGAAAAGAPADAAALAKTTEGALVDINVIDSYQAVEGAGTGMVLTSKGVVLTNNHVVEGET